MIGASLVREAARFATVVHATQMRKWTGEQYIVHPKRVAARVESSGMSWEAIAAAWLHDVLEDCGITYVHLASQFGEPTALMVRALTNPSKAFPEMRRADRKAMDREWIGQQSREVRQIKLIDRTDNMRDLGGAEMSFKKLYLAESRELLLLLSGRKHTPHPTVIDGTDIVLERELEEAMRAVERSIYAAQTPKEIAAKTRKKLGNHSETAEKLP